MRQDVAELFDRTKVSDLNYREITSDARADEAIQKWPILALTFELLTEGAPVRTPAGHGAADLFGAEVER